MFVSDTSRKFQIVWDLGRRCTYACTYCPPHRNNKTSPLIKFEELKETMDFIDEYFNFYQDFRKETLYPSLSFTGGEPTIHRDFFKFCKYVKDTYGDKYRVNLTTNGAFAKKILDNIDQYCDGGTISYHPEGDAKQKKLVLESIYKLGVGGRMGINVMFHKDYFDECVELCDELERRGIKYKARRIGDDGNDPKSILLGYTHVYTEEQEAIFDQYAGIKNSKKGRGCCGGRCMKFQAQGDNMEKEGWFLPSTNFQGWSCGINWYFLYLNQETRDIYLHQTCQVNLDGELGPIGNLDDTDKLLDRMTEMFYEKREIPVIKCPKTFCGCGMCIDKSDDFEKYVSLQENKIHSLNFVETEQKPLPQKRNPLRLSMEALDAKEV